MQAHNCIYSYNANSGILESKVFDLNLNYFTRELKSLKLRMFA